MVLIDGEPGDGQISVFDDGLLRGDGCFEAIRSYDGRPFAWEEHYLRLTASAGALGIPVPAATDWHWVGRGSGGRRRLHSPGRPHQRGHRPRARPRRPDASSCRIPIPMVPAGLSLLPLRQLPGIQPGDRGSSAASRPLSYAPNLAASRLARRAGYDDALLVSDAETILEGPTFSFAWVRGRSLGNRRTRPGDPRLDHEAADDRRCPRSGIEVVEGRFDLSRLEGASEALAISTVKQVLPVVRVGALTFPVGEVGATLNKALTERDSGGRPALHHRQIAQRFSDHFGQARPW